MGVVYVVDVISVRDGHVPATLAMSMGVGLVNRVGGR